MNDDLIRRRDAINGIRNAMKRIYTAARKLGYKEAMDNLEQLPSARETEISLTEPVSLSPRPAPFALVHSIRLVAVRQLRRQKQRQQKHTLLPLVRR